LFTLTKYSPGEQHAAIPNPFAPKPNYTAYTPDEVAALQCRLDKQLGPEYLLTRDGPGGQRLTYIPAEKVINLANEIFGFNGWSSSIQNVNVDFVDETSAGKFTMGCAIICRVTLKDGAYHEVISKIDEHTVFTTTDKANRTLDMENAEMHQRRLLLSKNRRKKPPRMH
jgi:recombination DNA repair RAD52 pathway protein